MNLFTIGYATKHISDFISQLKFLEVTALVDVRSVPFSGTFREYNQNSLADELKKHNIHYIHLGDELGPRSTNPSHYNSSNQVQFDRLCESPLFKSGMDRIKSGLDRGYNIAMMCAEKDPGTCHRSLLISEAFLDQMIIEVQHICFNGEIEPHKALQERIAELNKIPLNDMFRSRDECIQQAIAIQSDKYAYKKPIESIVTY